MKIVALSITLALVGCALACRPIIRLYESECCGDDYVEVAREFIGITDEPNLTAKGFKNWYLHTCPEGVWLGYEFENYTGSNTILASGKNTVDGLYSCSYQNTGNKVRSVKLVGSSADFTKSALVTFPETYNNGPETNLFNDTSYISEPFESFLIIGDEEVELFTQGGFRGLSICVRPNNFYINSWSQFEEVNKITNGTSRFTYVGSVTSIFGTKFQSFRFGCDESSNSLLETLK